MTNKEIIQLMSRYRFDFSSEKTTQAELEQLFLNNNIEFEREKYLDKNNIPDFFIKPGICIEVKIKGGKAAIFRQLERYAKFDEVNEIILLTNRSMGLPKEINSKPAIIINLGRAYL